MADVSVQENSSFESSGLSACHWWLGLPELAGMESRYLSTVVELGKRSVKKVPFVELREGRIQGVVSSGSDIERVYVSFIEVKTGNYSCSTNNNRPCGGLRGGPCKHIMEMVGEAVEEYGSQRVSEFLGCAADVAPVHHLAGLRGSQAKDNVAVIFTRFLDYLRLCELKAEPRLVAEMNWY
jgi:hypothetical protein